VCLRFFSPVRVSRYVWRAYYSDHSRASPDASGGSDGAEAFQEGKLWLKPGR